MARGGARPNSGGKRAGAGRPPKVLPPLSAKPDGVLPLDFMLLTMRDPAADQRVRLDAAKAAAPYLHQKIGEGGKKDAKQEAAKSASRGKFAPSAPPKLAIVKNA